MVCHQKEFDKLKKLKLLNCQICKSQKIEKSLMKPNLAKANFKKEKNLINNKIIKNKLKEYQKFIRKTLSMLVKISLMRQDLFTIIKIKVKKIFMVKLQKKTLKN